MSNVLELPNEVLYSIIQFIPPSNYKEISLVCRRLYELAYAVCDDKYLQRGFLWACRYNKVEVVRKLLNVPKVDPTIFRNKGLCDACEMGHIEVVIHINSYCNVDV